MDYFIGALIGLVVGAVVMFFVYRNNKKLFEDSYDKLQTKLVETQVDMKNAYDELEEKYFKEKNNVEKHVKEKVKEAEMKYMKDKKVVEDKYNEVVNKVKDVYDSVEGDVDSVKKKLEEIINMF